MNCVSNARAKFIAANDICHLLHCNILNSQTATNTNYTNRRAALVRQREERRAERCCRAALQQVRFRERRQNLRFLREANRSRSWSVEDDDEDGRATGDNADGPYREASIDDEDSPAVSTDCGFSLAKKVAASETEVEVKSSRV